MLGATGTDQLDHDRGEDRVGSFEDSDVGGGAGDGRGHLNDHLSVDPCVPGGVEGDLLGGPLVRDVLPGLLGGNEGACCCGGGVGFSRWSLLGGRDPSWC